MWRSSRSDDARRLLLAAAVLLLAPPVAAQVPSASDAARGPVIVGDVRVRAPAIAKFRIVGTVDRATPETLVVRGFTRKGADTVWSIPASAISRLQVANGTHGNALQGLGLGLLAGAAAGAGIGALSCNDSSSEWGPGACALVLGTLGGGAGAVVGLVAGALTHSVRWVDAPTHPLRVSLDWQNREAGLRLGATFAF